MSTITPLPTPVPSRADPANFAVRADEFLGALPTFGDECNIVAGEVNANAAAADASAIAAAASAAAALVSENNAEDSAVAAAASATSALNAPGTNATSTTSLTIGTGTKNLTIQTGKAYTVGQFLVIAYTTTPSNYMQGQITSYNSGTGALVVEVTAVGGSGTYANWSIGLTAIVAAGNQVSSFSAGTTGFTPSVATTGAVTLGGTLGVANGGTGGTNAATARTNLSAAQSGVNSDITQLTGLTTALSPSQGGTGNSTYAIGDLLFASSSTVLSKLADVATGNVLLSGGVGVAPAYGKVGLSTHVSGILPVANGGTGASASTGSGNVVLATGPSLSTPALSAYTVSTSPTVTAGTNAQGQGALTSDYNVITSTPNNPSGVTLPTATVGRKVTVVNRGINTINIYPATGAGIDALATNAHIALAINSYIEFHADTTTHWNSTARLLTDNIPAGGVTSFSAGTTGFTPSTNTSGVVTLAGTLNAVNGGTGLSSYTAGDLIVASTGTALTQLSSVATGNVLLSGGVGASPSYGKVGLTTHVSGTLGVTNGGTGLATIPAASILVANSADTITTVTAAANQSIRRNAGNTAWEAYTPSAGAGDVTGPASAVDNNLAAFNGTTGKLIKDSGLLTSNIALKSAANTFSASNVFGNSSGQVFLASTTTTQDGIVINGRAGGTNTYRVTISPTTLTANRAVTMPDAAGTVILDTATQTLTNKTISADNNTISGIAASSFVLSNASGNIDGSAAQKAIPSGAVVGTTDTQTLTNKTLTSPSISDPTMTGAVYSNGSARSNIVAVGALDIDCSTGNYFTKTINGNITFTFSNAPSSRAYAFTLELTHTSGTVTWPTAVKWPGNTAPTLTTGKTHLFTFVTDDAGTRWRGVSNVDYDN